MVDPIEATSELYWKAALATAALDGVLLMLLVWRVDRGRYKRLQPAMLLVSLVFFGALYGWAFNSYWDSCYAMALPGWFRTAALPLGLVVGAIGNGLWWLARRLPGHPAPWFLAMGGLQSLPGHLVAIYGRDLLEKCPILLGVEPAAALVFGVFEFGAYWSAVLLLSLLLGKRMG